VLYDLLTPREHLRLVCELKGLNPLHVNEEITRTLQLVDLSPHADKLANTLSGGMKRKLSLGMAIVGGSRVIILDEPTSGLDVDSRQKIWQLIKQIKQGRSIIMSSQHLEEADELADRICIMSHGKLLALDTPFGIKKRFGVGYNLHLEAKDNASVAQLYEMKSRVDDFVAAGIEGAEPSPDSSSKKLIYVLPFGQIEAFPDFLDRLHQEFPNVYIDMEMTSLEDAYVNMAKEEERLHRGRIYDEPEIQQINMSQRLSGEMDNPLKHGNHPQPTFGL